MSNLYGKSSMGLGYAGRIKLKVKSGDKILSEKVLHNAGGEALFNYLVLCLAGEYDLAKRSRPLKIRLFCHDITAYNEKELPKTPVTNDLNAASNFISMTAAPTITKNSITLHYVVPFSQITKTAIDQICLYGVSESDSKNYSAFFLITETTKTGEEKLSSIQVTKAMSNLSLILDWELILGNAEDFIN